MFYQILKLANWNNTLIRDTQLENIIICHLKQKNIHGQIFGRFFVEQTFELAFLTCYMFGGITPLFLEVVHV
jgi:acyl-coenzyme A thioesterase 9